MEETQQESESTKTVVISPPGMVWICSAFAVGFEFLPLTIPPFLFSEFFSQLFSIYIFLLFNTFKI